MTKQILRMKDLVESGRVPNKQTGYRWVRAGILPPGRLFGPNTRGWFADELAEFDARLPTGLKPAPPVPRRKPASTEEHATP